MLFGVEVKDGGGNGEVRAAMARIVLLKDSVEAGGRPRLL